MERLINISGENDIPSNYRNTPVDLLLKYHNLGRKSDNYYDAQLIIGTCMDNRISLSLPPGFAYVIRSAGANMRSREFNISYAIAVAGVKYMVLIGHNNCAMNGLDARKEEFINGLVQNGGWKSAAAEIHFLKSTPDFETGNETDFVLYETKRIRQNYPGLTIAPMMYIIENKRLYLIKDDLPG